MYHLIYTGFFAFSPPTISAPPNSLICISRISCDWYRPVNDSESEDVITLLGPLSTKLSMRSPFDLDMANDDEVLQSKLMIDTRTY